MFRKAAELRHNLCGGGTTPPLPRRRQSSAMMMMTNCPANIIRPCLVLSARGSAAVGAFVFSNIQEWPIKLLWLNALVEI